MKNLIEFGVKPHPNVSMTRTFPLDKIVGIGPWGDTAALFLQGADEPVILSSSYAIATRRLDEALEHRRLDARQ